MWASVQFQWKTTLSIVVGTFPGVTEGHVALETDVGRGERRRHADPEVYRDRDRVKEGDQMKQHVCWQNAWLLNPELLGAITNPPSLSPLAVGYQICPSRISNLDQ